MTHAQAIAHYLIDRELGRGGMGVVYRGVDTKLNRTVAIKSLPAQYSSDEGWRRRFETEAKTLASVNHPNIAAIYGIEADETGAYLILELAEGPTLDEQLVTKPPDVYEALDVCGQVAMGIAAAHQRGIIHRDLKPSNIKLRPDGVVKVLDFGIAKSNESGPVDASQATVVAVRVNAVSTIPGFMMGTPGYMAPEQARGQGVTPATDLWSLGCVLYECLTHRLAFPGDTLADTIAVTLLVQPDMTVLPPKTPGRVVRLLQTCLAKDQRQRTVTMAQAASILAEAAREVAASRVPVHVNAPSGESGYEAEAGNWPQFDDRLWGRGEALAQLSQALGECRLVTLTGQPGVGASRLAIRAAQMRRTKYRGGVWWVALPQAAGHALPATLTALTLGARGQSGGPVSALKDRIAERSMLLVLDGCASAASACASLALDLLRACPNLQVLATSRSALGIDGETAIAVRALGDGQHDAGAADSTNFLLDRGRMATPGFSLAVDAVGAKISRWFGGNPLAIELAAPLAATMALETFETQLQLRAGMSGPGSLSPERLCRLLTSWALDLLPPTGLAVMLRTSAFVGAVSVRGGAAAGGSKDSLPAAFGEDAVGGPLTTPETRLADQLSRLAARGLVRLIPGAESPTRPCYIVPGVVRAESLARLRETPAAELVVMNGYRGYLLALADHAAAHLEGPAGEAFASRLEGEFADLATVAQSSDAGAERAREAVLRLLKVRGLA